MQLFHATCLQNQHNCNKTCHTCYTSGNYNCSNDDVVSGEHGDDDDVSGEHDDDDDDDDDVVLR